MSQRIDDNAIDFFEINEDVTLRRMVLRNPRPKGTVLFLHGFPETLYAWKDIALALADEYEVHAFDWPGYGLSSRPTVDRFSYAPKDYAHVLDQYIAEAGIETSRLTIYATDIGALPALLLAVEKPDIARTIIVGDFAPFNRPPVHVREPAKRTRTAQRIAPTTLLNSASSPSPVFLTTRPRCSAIFGSTRERK
jgi:pimeloyl-ACP methyl ester carboxylesterase